MWLVTSFGASAIASVIWAYAPNRFRLGSLALMSWGLTLMVFVDHVMSYSGGPFIMAETDGLIRNGTMLGIVMLIPIFVIWGIQLLTTKSEVEMTLR
jgi:hypothetical protein